MEKNNKSMVEELNNIKPPKKHNSTEDEVLQFFIGIILLGAGLFMLSRRVLVHSSWYMWRIGNFDLSSGTVTIPLIIGIIWHFAKPKSIFPKILITLSVVFIILTIIMGIRISFVTTSMFEYVLMLGMASAGAGLLLKTLFTKRD